MPQIPVTNIDVANFYSVSSGKGSIRVGKGATHTPSTIALGQESANYVVNQCRFSNHRFNGGMASLIYNYDPIYSGKHKKNPLFEQIYLSHENSK